LKEQGMAPFKRVIIIATLLLTSVVCFIMLQNVSSATRNIETDYLSEPLFDPSLEKDYVKEFATMGDPSGVQMPNTVTIDRDIFVEKQDIVITPLFVLRSIEKEEIPIVFKGSIVRGDEVIIAQINWGNKTYFVKPNEMLKQWLIAEITENFVIIKDTDSKPFTLFLNRVTYSEIMVASVLYTKENKIYRVKVGDLVDDYKVLDIKNENVIVSNKNSQIIISKDA
jgi:hypothetical protein